MSSRGVVLQGGGRAGIVVQEPPRPSGTQVLVRTHAVGLCGSDMALYEGTYEGPRNYPLYFGHEWSGTIEAVGPDVAELRPGDRVTGDCSIYCGACEFCARDRNLCQQIEKFGITVDGASRQHFLQEARYVYKADSSVELELLALSEPMAVGAHAVRRVREARPGLTQDKVLVLGGGSIGLSCLFALKYLEGCEQVELFDIVESRVKKARELGASEPTDIVEAGSDTDDYGGLYSGLGYDVIFETSGAVASFRRAIELVRPLGTIMALGFIPSIEFSLKQVTLKAARVMGSIGGTGDFEPVLDLMHRRPELPRALITNRVPFQDFARAFDLATDRRNAIKVLVTF